MSDLWVFFAVGSFVGAVTGALIGLATESGLFRGAGIGAISGAVFSIEVVESSLALWHSNESGIWSILYVVLCFFLRSLSFGVILLSFGWFLMVKNFGFLFFVFVLKIDIITSLLSGRLVREKVGPAVQSAVQSQVINRSASLSP